MKTCARCKELKPFSEFYKRTVSPDGVDCRCKECRKLTNKEWSDAHPGSKLANALKWQIENKERANKRSAEWRAKNKERRKEIVNGWARRNLHKRRDAVVRRRLKTVIPAWADRNAIARFYEEAARVSKDTGVPHHVDHIVPINSKLVCGLHVQANLQVLPARENVLKRNLAWPDMP